jgi:glycosyltransferase involved in cell wall biosynthesis
MKKVAMYYPWCYLKSGVERVILETIQRSRHRYTLFTNHIDYDQTFSEFRSLADLRVLNPVSVHRSFRQTLRGVWTIATQKLDLTGYDALLVQSEGLGDFISLRNHAIPLLSFCHTPVRPVYDPVYRREWMAKHPSKRLALEAFSAAYRVLNVRVWKRYGRVFANSGEVRSRILQGGLCEPERLEVLNPGVDVDAIRPGRVSDRYFLYAGRIKWTKNVDLALRAFAAFLARAPEASSWKLIVAGSVDKGGPNQEYFRELQALAGPQVEFRLDPSREELDRIYDRCYALLYTPLNEDWGIVPIEAMAFAKPVLAVNSGGPKETVRDGETGYLLEPTPEAFASRMAALAADPGLAQALGDKGRERAYLYSWNSFVQRLDDYIDSLQP